jgi:hypothetical protein
MNLEIWWPASDTHQTFSNVAKNQFIEIKEFEKNYTQLERQRTRLGGKLHPIAKATPGANGARDNIGSSRARN